MPRSLKSGISPAIRAPNSAGVEPGDRTDARLARLGPLPEGGRVGGQGIDRSETGDYHAPAHVPLLMHLFQIASPPSTWKHLTGNVRRTVAGEKADQFRYVPRGPGALQRDQVEHSLTHRLVHGAGHVGVDIPRGHHVDAHPAGRHLLGEALGEPDDARLGRRVVGLPRIAVQTGHRRNVDDRAGARPHHAAHHLAAGHEGSGQVGHQHRVPVGALHAHHQPVAGDAGVVDQHVDAPLFVQHRIDGGGRGLLVGDVDLPPVHGGSALGGAPLPLRLLRGGRTGQVVDGRRLAQQRRHHRRADAARAAGDQCDPAVQFPSHRLLRRRQRVDLFHGAHRGA